MFSSHFSAVMCLWTQAANPILSFKLESVQRWAPVIRAESPRSRSAWENTIFKNAALRQHNYKSLSKAKNCAFLCEIWRCAESFIATCGWIHLVLNHFLWRMHSFIPSIYSNSMMDVFRKDSKNNKTHVYSLSSHRNTSTFWRMKSASITPSIMLIRISYLLQYGLLHNFSLNVGSSSRAVK